MRDWLTMYRVLAWTTLKARAAYRWNFFLSLFFQMVLLSAELAVVLLIVARVNGIGGFSVDEVLLLFGLTITSSGLFRVFASELHDFDKYLVYGEFDGILTRPVPTWLAVAGRSIDVEQLGAVLQGAVALSVAMVRLHLVARFGSIEIAEALTGVLAGTLVWLGLVTGVAALGFWTTRIDELQPMLLYGPETASSFPLSIYPAGIRVLFYSVIPVAFGSYVPALVMLHKPGAAPVDLVYSVLAGLAAFGVSLVLWQAGVRHYASTGT